MNPVDGMWHLIHSHESHIRALKDQIDAVNLAATGDLGHDAVMSLTNSLLAQITALRDAIDALKVEMNKYEDPELPLNKILERVTQRSDFDYATAYSHKPVTECLADWVPRHGGPVAMECITHSALETIAFQAVRKQLPSDTCLENMHTAAKWMAEHGNDTLLKFLESEDFRAFVAEKQVMERLS